MQHPSDCSVCEVIRDHPELTNTKAAQLADTSESSIRRHRRHVNPGLLSQVDPIFGVPQHAITSRGASILTEDGSWQKIMYDPRKVALLDALSYDDVEKAIENFTQKWEPVLASINKIAVLCPADLQLGKGLASETPVLTTEGWKTHGELREGDLVFGADGSSKRVLAVRETTTRDLYRVTFGDGSSIVCDDQHMWAGSRKYHEWSSQKWVWRDNLVLSMGELIEMYSGPSVETRPFVVKETEPIQFPEKMLPIDPYLFGLWLGDGFTRTGRICAGVADSDLITPYGHRVKGAEREGLVVVRVPGLSKKLGQLGVLGAKRVPQDYLLNSEENRRSLLQGLMDTDGYASVDGLCEFTNTNEDIANAVAFLVNSLGMNARVTTKVGTLNGVPKSKVWRVVFRPDGVVFRMERKQNRCRPATERTYLYRSIRSIEKVPSGEAQCITVEGGLYVAGKALTVTHNCDENGGTESVIRRVLLGVDLFAQHCKATQPAEIVIADLGDIIEGFDNTDTQRATNDIDLTTQIRVARRLIVEVLGRVKHLAPVVSYVSVPSNHAQVRIPGSKALASTPSNDWGLEISHQIEDIVTGREGWETVRFVRPTTDWSEAITHKTVLGFKLGLVHGHQSRAQNKMGDWWSAQAFGRRNGLHEADMLLHGHYHNLSMCQVGDGRWLIGAPSADPGSAWFSNVSGTSATAGMLAFDINVTTTVPWSNLRIL